MKNSRLYWWGQSRRDFGLLFYISYCTSGKDFIELPPLVVVRVQDVLEVGKAKNCEWGGTSNHWCIISIHLAKQIPCVLQVADIKVLLSYSLACWVSIPRINTS